MTTSIEKQEMVETLRGARTVDFITPILETATKLEMVKADAKHNKTAKLYLETVEAEYRNQMKFLYMAAQTAFPEDKRIEVSHALSSISPQDILDRYEFKVIVSKKEGP